MCSYILPSLHAKIATKYRGMFAEFGHIVCLFYVIYFDMIISVGMACFTNISGERGDRQTPAVIALARLVVLVDGAWNSFL